MPSPLVTKRLELTVRVVVEVDIDPKLDINDLFVILPIRGIASTQAHIPARFGEYETVLVEEI